MAVTHENPYSSRPSGSEPPDASDPYVGHTFGERYVILAKIGEGSQARVYLARHALIDRLVAVKFLLPVLAADKNLVARFLNEGRAAGALGHPNIVESLDMGFAPDSAPYLVLELLRGRTLADEIVLSRALRPSRAAYIGSQIASALAAAHAREIVHRDLKPANVLLVERSGRPDHVKVLDFGISKFNAGGSRVTTIKGQTLGTPGFMAPEQVEDPLNIDGRADVYGLGATLYDMLCGVPPFAEVGFPKILRLIVEEEPRRLAEMRPDLPVGLVEIVERAMSKSPADRYQTMEELEDALLGFAEEPVRSRAPEPLNVQEVRAALSTAAAPRSERAEPPAPSESVEPSRRSRSKRKLAILGLLLSFGVLALLVAWLGGALDAKPSARAPRAREPQAEVQVPHLQVNQVGPAAAPASGEPKVVPGATASAGGHDRPSPGRNAGRAEARTTRVAISRPAPGPTEEPANCSPPFYYEGRKKLYKPGCI